MTDIDSISSLKDAFKLSLYEVRTYITLLEGVSDIKTIATRAKVPHPRIYDTLRSLEEKGFVKKVGDKHDAVDPRISLDGRIRQFKKEFESEIGLMHKAKEKIIPSLILMRRANKEQQGGFEMLRGINSIANKFIEVMQHSHNSIITVRKAFEAKDLFLGHLIDSDLTDRDLKIIVPKDHGISRRDISLLSEMGFEVRRRNNILLDLMVSDSDDVIIGVPDPVSDEPHHAIAIWVKNSSFAESLMNSLRELWERNE